MGRPGSVLVVGGGIAGLTAAYRLQQLARQQRQPLAVSLLEASGRFGGKILTERPSGYIIEGGPDCFLSRKQPALALAEELGLAGRLQGRLPAQQKSFVKRNGRLYPLPEGLTGMIPTDLAALAGSPLLSDAGRARLAQEPLLPPAPASGDESVASFISRRLGREAYEQLVEPLMGGIYAGDGEQLSLAATFPHLRQLELTHGSLLRGLQAQQATSQSRTAADLPPFLAFPKGMAELVDALVAAIPDVTLLPATAAAAVTPLARGVAGYEVTAVDGRCWQADALILAVPAPITARLVEGFDPQLAAPHAAIPYVATAVVTLAYSGAEIDRPLDGYGYVVPRAAGGDILACTWSSRKWAGRAPDGQQLLRVYVGRYGRPDISRYDDGQLLALARDELLTTLGIAAPPALHRIHRWPMALPQYNLGHQERLATIADRLARWPKLRLAGAAYQGVGIPDCIASGDRAARDLWGH